MPHDPPRPVTRRHFVAAAGAGLAALPLTGAVPVDVPPGPADAAGADAGAGGGAQPPRRAPSAAPCRPATTSAIRPSGASASRWSGSATTRSGQILPRIAATRHVRLAALVSGNRDKARAVAAAYGRAERSVYDYATFDRLRDDATVDAVYVILPVRCTPSTPCGRRRPASTCSARSRWRRRRPSAGR
jgi:hypothetical protein